MRRAKSINQHVYCCKRIWVPGRKGWICALSNWQLQLFARTRARRPARIVCVVDAFIAAN